MRNMMIDGICYNDGFDMVAAHIKKSNHLSKIANELYPTDGKPRVNFIGLSNEQRDSIYVEYCKQLKY